MAFAISGSNINMSGAETAQALATFVAANPTTGSVSGRQITISFSLIWNANNTTLTGEGWAITAVGTAVFRCPAGRTGCSWTWNRGSITVAGSGRTVTNAVAFNQLQSITLNFTETWWAIFADSRYDWFSSLTVSPTTYNFNNVVLLDGGTGFNNMHVVNPSASVPLIFSGVSYRSTGTGAAPLMVLIGATATSEIIFNDLAFGGNGTGGTSGTGMWLDGGQVVFNRINWPAISWPINRRAINTLTPQMVFRNPIKPAGWTGWVLTDNKGSISEVHTWTPTVRSGAGPAISNARVNVHSSSGTVLSTALTNTAGTVAPIDVQTRFVGNGSSSQQTFNDHSISVAVFGFLKSSGARTFNNTGASGGIAEVIFLIPDAAITQSDSEINAYTTIQTLDQLYMAQHYWGVQQANAGYPSLSEFPVVASGTSLNLGSRNLVVDGTAATAFTINTTTNTITVKAAVLAAGSNFTSLTTTGTITTTNGAQLSAQVTDAAGTRIRISLDGGGAFTAQIAVNSTLQTVQFGVTTLPLTVQPADNITIAMGAFGKKARVITTTGAALTQNATFALETDPVIDQAVNQGTLDAITSALVGATINGNVVVFVEANLASYTPAEALAGLQYWIVTQATTYWATLVQTGNANLITFERGRVNINTANYWTQPSEAWGVTLTIPDRGVAVPLVIESDVSGARPVRTNASGVVLCTPHWTQQEADINGALVADSVWSAPNRTLNGDYFD